MALISCPGCGKEVSDKAYRCPKCGFLLKERPSQICTECGEIIPTDAACCPNCGAPVQSIADSPDMIGQMAGPGAFQPQKKRKGGWIVAIVLAAIACCISFYYHSETVRIDTYNKFVDLYNTMSQGSAKAEEANCLIIDVWHNCIWQNSDPSTDVYTRKNSGEGAFYTDFNDAIDVLYRDEAFAEKVREIYDHQTKATSILRELTDLPDSFLEEYSDFKNCYTLFLKFTDMSVSPQGNLAAFTDDHNSLDRELAEKLKALQIYFSE